MRDCQISGKSGGLNPLQFVGGKPDRYDLAFGLVLGELCDDFNKVLKEYAITPSGASMPSRRQVLVLVQQKRLADCVVEGRTHLANRLAFAVRPCAVRQQDDSHFSLQINP